MAKKDLIKLNQELQNAIEVAKAKKLAAKLDEELKSSLKPFFGGVSSIVGAQGEDGEKGDKGERGEKGDKGDSIKGEKGDKGDKGDRGEIGPQGLDGKDGKNGLNGLDGKDGKDGINGVDGTLLAPEEIRNKLETLGGEERLDASAIKNLPNPSFKGGGGGILDVLAGDNITVNRHGNKVTINSTATTGTGSGDVVGPAANTADYIPQWNGANSKTLKDGLAVPAGGLAGLDALNAKFTLPALTAGSVLFSNGTTIAQDNANLFWDDTNNRLGIGTTAPGAPLDVLAPTATDKIATFQGNKTTGGYISIYDSLNATVGTRGFVGYGATLFTGLAITDFGLRSQGGMAFATNGATPQMYINTSGNVGIGTTAPGAALDIASGNLGLVIGAVNGSNTRTDATNKVARIGTYHYTNNEEPVAVFHGDITTAYNSVNIGGGSGIMNAATQIGFFTAANTTTVTGTERIRIQSDGNVGIGTTAPATGLQVGASTTGSAPGRITLDSTAATEPGMIWNSAGVLKWLMYRPANSNDLRMYDGTDRVTFQSGGNVGIGTTSPGSNLHLAKLSGSAIFRIENSGNGNTSAIDFYRERSTGAGLEGANIFLNSDTSTTNALLYLQAQSASLGNTTNPLTAANGARMILRGGSGVISFENGASETVRFDASGNVGIGTTGPTSKLHIVGSITYNYTTTAVDLTLDATHYLVNVTVASKTITLPTAASITGRTYKIDNASAGNITVACTGAETINGETTQTVPLNSCIEVYSNGANWRIS